MNEILKCVHRKLYSYQFHDKIGCKHLFQYDFLHPTLAKRNVISIRSFLMCVHVAQFIYGPYGSLYSILKNPLKYKLEFVCQDPLRSIVSFTETKLNDFLYRLIFYIVTNVFNCKLGMPV